MAGSLNRVMIIGNLGRDPELRYTTRGNAVCNFTVAVNRPGRTDENGRRSEDETEWFSVVAWDKLAETCNQFLSKGRKVYVEGRLQSRSYDDKDGNKRYITEVVADDVILLGGRGEGGSTSVPEPAGMDSSVVSMPRTAQRPRPAPTAQSGPDTDLGGQGITDDDVPF